MFHIISFFAFFTVLSHIGVVLGWSFQTLANLSFVPLLCSVGLYYFLKVKKLKPVEEYSDDLNNNKFDYIYLILAYAIAFSLVLFVYMSDSDEAFYASIENHALANIDLPYLKYDGMFGEPDKLILHISYKVQSYQMLSAVASYLFDIPNLLARHIFFPIVATFLFLITWTKLFKLFLPQKWQLATLILMFFVLLEGSFRGLTFFSITRFFDGKCILVHVLIPLILYYTIIYFRNPKPSIWIYLFVIQIAGVGLSSSAVYLFPIQLLVLGTCYLRMSFNQIRKIFIYGLTGLYPLVVGVILKLLIVDHNSLNVASESSIGFYISYVIPKLFLGSSIFGNPFALMVNILSIFIAWKFLPKNSDLRRLLILLPIVVFGVLLNPFLFGVISTFTTKYTYHRLGFMMPIALFFTILVTNLIKLQNDKPKELNGIASSIFIFIFMCFPWFMMKHSYFNQNYELFRNEFFKPRLEKDLDLVTNYIIENNPKDSRVLAIGKFSSWISTSPTKDKPKLVSISIISHDIKDYHSDKVTQETFSYQRMMNNSFNEEEVEIREYLQLVISGYKEQFDEEIFIDYLNKMNVGTVAYSSLIKDDFKLAKTLQKAGYSKKFGYKQYEVWLK